ncbi:GAF domain-containing protein [Paenibacillus humicola]|uniref:GAF domain-containing protein n=1 Tax=Paenibacillus humicola TaxID=3110540 RepID=UPI00237A5881|nr:GAF domain-containing protein [Paenibacillus humicola]
MKAEEREQENLLFGLRLRLVQYELLIDAAQYLTSSLALDDVFTRILDRAQNVIEAADAGVLSIYDKETVLRPMACTGFLWEKMRHLHIAPGESMTGLTFESRTPRIFQQSHDVIRHTASMSAVNKIYYEQSLAPIKRDIGQHFKIKSVMCAPLLIKGECIGVMAINSFMHGTFSENDLSLLITLSNLAAVALENARLYQDEKNKKEKLAELNDVIQLQNHRLYRINQTHESLMKLILNGKSAVEFGAAVSGILGNPILIYDSLLGVLTRAPARLDLELGAPSFVAALQTVLKTWKPRRVQPNPKGSPPCSVLLCPIVTSDEIFGILAVLEINSKLSEQDVVLAEQCCLVLALDFLKKEAVYETEQRIKGEFLDELISEKNVATLRERARSLGLEAENPLAFMVAEIDFAKAPRQEGLRKAAHRRIQQTIEAELHGLNPSSLVIRRLNAFVMILPLSRSADAAAALKRSRSIARRLSDVLRTHHPDANCSIGIGRMCRNFGGVMQSYQEAKQCVALIKSRKDKHAVKDYVEMGAIQFVLDRPKDQLLQFVYGLLQPLLDYPPHKRDELMKALDAFIVSGKSHKQAAAMLNIHPNTFAYRLKRVEDILGIRIDDYSTFFDLQYAWQVLEMLDLKNGLLGTESDS